MRSPDVDLLLAPTTNAPRLARISLRSACDGRLQPGLLADAELLVSELVTNACRHGQGAIRLRIGAEDDRVAVEVIDAGKGFEVPAPLDHTGPGGRGLTIIRRIATRWGLHAGRSHVWFELVATDPDVTDQPDSLAPVPEAAAVVFRCG